MNPEAAEAIRIADKHLAGKSPERRMALAKDILAAVMLHAQHVAADAIKTATSRELAKDNT